MKPITIIHWKNQPETGGYSVSIGSRTLRQWNYLVGNEAARASAEAQANAFAQGARCVLALMSEIAEEPKVRHQVAT